MEQFIEGEITVAILNGTPLPVISIRPKTDFFDLNAKYTKGMTDYLVPSPLPEEILIQAQTQAKIATRL